MWSDFWPVLYTFLVADNVTDKMFHCHQTQRFTFNINTMWIFFLGRSSILHVAIDKNTSVVECFPEGRLIKLTAGGALRSSPFLQLIFQSHDKPLQTGIWIKRLKLWGYYLFWPPTPILKAQCAACFLTVSALQLLTGWTHLVQVTSSG